MLTREENEMLTRVGPGTPAGELLRRYWHPVGVASELTAENPTQIVRILGETLVLFRDKKGRIGLLDDRCSHRSSDFNGSYDKFPGNDRTQSPTEGGNSYDLKASDRRVFTGAGAGWNKIRRIVRPPMGHHKLGVATPHQSPFTLHCINYLLSDFFDTS